MSLLRLLILTMLVTGCRSVSADPIKDEAPRLVPIPQIESPTVPLFPSESSDAPRFEAPTHVATLIPDPYVGWQTWCEPPKLRPCKSKADCKGIAHPANKPMKCVRPWYSDDPEYRVCSPGYANRHERKRQRARIRELVRLQYTAELDVCPSPGWPCGRERQRGNALASFLAMVAQRETTKRPWKRHRLDGDIAGAVEAWANTAAVYGHRPIFKEAKGRKKLDHVRFEPDGNRHYAEQERWAFGLGLYGANAALNVRNWDPMAPPEVLCREVEATESYLRAARTGWRKLRGGIDCDGDPGREWHGIGGAPTWYDVHRVASGGKFCPSAKSRRKFEGQAEQVGLDPYAQIRLSDLGTPIESDGQIATAQMLLTKLDVFTTGWELHYAMN